MRHGHSTNTTRHWWVLAVPGVVVFLALGACSNDDSIGFDFDFGQGPAGWEPGFADYPVGEDAFYRLEADYLPLPDPLGPSRSGLFIAGTNYSDDLWMQYKAEASLPADRTFRVRFDVELATNALAGCVGVGGAPGEDVTVKAGVTIAEPDREADPQGTWRLTVDKGQQTQAGADAVVVGDLASSTPCDETPAWEIKGLSGSMMFTTDSTGRAWLYVGTDSGYEARSEVYYTRFQAMFDPL